MLIKKIAIWTIFIIAISFPLFSHLDSAPLHEWDEGRLANNALEMCHSRNWLVTTYNGHTDLYNVKPPFVIWLQALALKILGINELAIRVPSAVAALLTSLLIILFFTKKYKTPLLGCICAGVLITTQGYVTVHGTRTGDYDAVLTLLTASALLSWFLFLEEENQKYLYSTFVLFTLAVLTKDIEALLFVPSLLVYTLYKKKLLTVAGNRHFYFCLLVFVSTIAVYYALREHFDRGFIQVVIQNEATGRYKAADDIVGNKINNPWWYLEFLAGSLFHEWYLLVIPGVICGFASKHTWLRNITIYCVLLITGYLIIISNAGTKLTWYLMPLYPFLSFLAGIFIYSLFSFLTHLTFLKSALRVNPFPYVFIFLVFIIPYKNIIAYAINDRVCSELTDENKDFIAVLKNSLHQKLNIGDCLLFGTSPQQNINWYYQAFAYKNRPLRLVDINGLKPGIKVVAYLDESKNYIEKNYYAITVYQYGKVKIYKLMKKL
jgi:4-amino-4-deoxy-L-arabinose transferase-like glycosyltransferase